MVIYEVKDTAKLSQSKKPQPIRKDIFPPLPVDKSKAISHLYGRQLFDERKRERRDPVTTSPADVSDVKRLVELVNLRLQQNGSDIHLVLIQEEDTLVLDIYDCSGGDRCRVVHDMVVGVEELQSLFARLQKESGIIFDQKF
nr:hypothetical protein [Desulfobulbaceae bacterium]